MSGWSPWIERLATRLPMGDHMAPGPGRFAAVSVLLHSEGPDTRVLLMKRVERPGDPWSGHISLPGGRFHDRDAHLLETAIRETREELAIDLSGARLLGQLPAMHPRTSGPEGIEVTPYVFATDVAVTPTPGPEALAAFWLPLDLAASGALDATYNDRGAETGYPSWNYDGHVIWGLTRRVLQDLIERGR